MGTNQSTNLLVPENDNSFYNDSQRNDNETETEMTDQNQSNDRIENN